jgi:hypothetical protein
MGLAEEITWAAARSDLQSDHHQSGRSPDRARRRWFTPLSMSPAKPAGPLGPLLDLRSQPQPRPATTQVNDRARHVWVSPLVERHRVALSKAQEFGHTMRVDQVVHIHTTTHGRGAYTC